jgi:hypothetical protein
MLLLHAQETNVKETDMQMRPQSWLLIAGVAVFGSGCAVTTTSDDDARTARLPTGVTLLESDRNECEGAVAIDESAIANSRRADLVVQRGQNATFEVDADGDRDVEIDWTCVGVADADTNTAECPEETTHVRITRASTGDEFLLECYGDVDGSASRRARR